jgi:uncharacterized protein (DUF2164 family)
MPLAILHDSFAEGTRISMSIELSKDMRQKAASSIVRYFREIREEELGIMAASGLLDFFLEEVDPTSTTRL